MRDVQSDTYHIFTNTFRRICKMCKNFPLIYSKLEYFLHYAAETAEGGNFLSKYGIGNDMYKVQYT